MFHAVLAARDATRTALAASVPGATPALYIGVRPATVVMPHAIMRAGIETPNRPRMAESLTTVTLDLFARSSNEAQLMEDSVAFLDDYRPANYGNALGVHYSLASKSRLGEAENIEHVTLLYSVTFVDKRKVLR